MIVILKSNNQLENSVITYMYMYKFKFIFQSLSH